MTRVAVFLAAALIVLVGIAYWMSSRRSGETGGVGAASPAANALTIAGFVTGRLDSATGQATQPA